MRKVERLVNLIARLRNTRRPLTLDQVAELVPGYEASGESLRRMFERDKEELRGLGVPVERAPIDAWGTEEGYFIDPKAYGMPELDLAPDERAALALAARAWSGAARDPAAVAGLAKLDLDPGAGPHALRADLHGASPLLTTLLEAVQGRKRIAFTYGPGDLMEAWVDGDKVHIGFADWFSRAPRLTWREAAGLYLAGRALVRLPEMAERGALSRALAKLEAVPPPHQLDRVQELAGQVSV